MKKGKKYLFVSILISSLLLSGCGTALYEMTPEEESVIVHSAAYYVAKHNIQQKDGVKKVVHPNDSVSEQGTEDAESTEDTETTESTQEQNPEGQGEVPEDPNSIEMVDVIGHRADLSISYDGYEIKNSFDDNGAYIIDAPAGKTYVVMKFQVTNTTEADVTLDNISSDLAFKLVSGDVSAKAEWTALSNDFSTYIGVIPAGQTVDTVLLFEVTETQAATISDIKLQISIDNVVKNIKL